MQLRTFGSNTIFLTNLGDYAEAFNNFDIYGIAPKPEIKPGQPVEAAV